MLKLFPPPGSYSASNEVSVCGKYERLSHLLVVLHGTLSIGFY